SPYTTLFPICIGNMLQTQQTFFARGVRPAHEFGDAFFKGILRRHDDPGQNLPRTDQTVFRRLQYCGTEGTADYDQRRRPAKQRLDRAAFTKMSTTQRATADAA